LEVADVGRAQLEAHAVQLRFQRAAELVCLFFGELQPHHTFKVTISGPARRAPARSRLDVLLQAASIARQFCSECARASSLELLSCASTTRVRSPSPVSSIVTVW